MSKPFNIHDWQAKQRNQLLNEGVWEVGSKQDIQEFIAKLKQLKNVYYNVVGSDEVQNGLDIALRAAEELMKHAKPGMDEHHEEGTFPEVDQKTKDYLDKLEKSIEPENPISFEKTDDSVCRYPKWDKPSDPRLCCGRKVYKPYSYCAYHVAKTRKRVES